MLAALPRAAAAAAGDAAGDDDDDGDEDDDGGDGGEVYCATKFNVPLSAPRLAFWGGVYRGTLVD